MCDVKQEPNKSNKAKLKQFNKTLKSEMKQREKAEMKQRKRFKRTSAEVSSEDKQLAEKAIEDLEARGASTDDLTCRLCNPEKTFTAFGGLLCHYKSHAGHRPFKCDKCQATFTRQHSLYYHIMTHDKTMRFTCPQPNCDRKFIHPSHFKEHVAKHGDVAKFDCQFCDSFFLSPKEYQMHIKSEHKKTENRGRKRTLAEVSSGDKQLAERAIEELQARGWSTKDLTCCLCDPAKPYTAYTTLLTHLRSQAGQRPFKCDQCQATFTRQHSLNYHVLTHEETMRFTCPQLKCNRKFRHHSHFKEHVTKKHGDVAKYDCPFCDSVFLSLKQYQKHLKSKHKMSETKAKVKLS